MIVSHRHRFIFLKTSKTAGTSIEIALAKLCGEHDVITPNAPADERIRRRLGHRGFQHCFAPWWEYRPRDLWRLLTRLDIKMHFYDHMPAREVLPLLGEDVWAEYFKFCFERNPWDRVLSYYHWKHRAGPKPQLADFLASDEPLLRLRRSGFELYSIDGRIAVDRVCRYEALADELRQVGARLGTTETLELPRIHASSREDRRHYREVLDPEQRDRIARVFRREIELFGYEF
jgi:hypothetical protein